MASVNALLDAASGGSWTPNDVGVAMATLAPLAFSYVLWRCRG